MALFQFRKEKKENVEYVTDIDMVPVACVAEPTEYQFGSEAFESLNSKMEQDKDEGEKTQTVPKTRKGR